jgi:hypothetical protein
MEVKKQQESVQSSSLGRPEVAFFSPPSLLSSFPHFFSFFYLINQGIYYFVKIIDSQRINFQSDLTHSNSDFAEYSLSHIPFLYFYFLALSPP